LAAGAPDTPHSENSLKAAYSSSFIETDAYSDEAQGSRTINTTTGDYLVLPLVIDISYAEIQNRA
jgi:hypothetical protein